MYYRLSDGLCVIQVTFGENINLNLALNYQTLLLKQNMTTIFASNPSFLVRSEHLWKNKHARC